MACMRSYNWHEIINVQYIPRKMRMVFALLCFVVAIHWLIFPYPSGLLHWHCGNLTIAPVPAKQPWWIWINTSCEFIMNDCIPTTKQSTTKPCAYFLGYTVIDHPGSTLHPGGADLYYVKGTPGPITSICKPRGDSMSILLRIWDFWSFHVSKPLYLKSVYLYDSTCLK